MFVRHARARRAAVALVAAGAVVLGASAVPATAAPPIKPGKVTGLAATVTKPAAAYDVAATWNASSQTTGYQVRLVNPVNGATLDSGTVTATAWTGHTTLPAMSAVRVSVTPVNGSRKGAAVTLTKTLPDVTAPTGAYDVAWTDSTATVTETQLTDDVSPAANITRLIDWGAGAGFEAWPSGTTVQHTYPLVPQLYRPQVRLTDQVGNVSTQTLHAVVVLDEAAPTGTFEVVQPTAWARLTTVQLKQLALTDNFSNAADVTRSVDWRDGSAVQAWPSLVDLPTHVYTTAGTYTPQVILTDEAGNTGTVDASAVVVTLDTVRPVVKLTLPKYRLKTVATWKVLKGTVKDTNGSGVARAEVRAVQKRATGWYAFRPASSTWVQAASSSAAWSKAGIRKVVPTATGAWTARLPGLRKGTLSYRVVGVDKTGNRSLTVSHKQLLTRY